MNDEININKSECLVVQSNIGNDKYINICTGEIKEVEWGNADKIGFGCAMVVLVMVIVGFIMTLKTLFDY